MDSAMTINSIISQETLKAYKETEFRVFSNPPITLKVSEKNTDLLHRYKQHNFHSCAFITACNPFGKTLSDENNLQLQENLASLLKQKDFSFVAGEGKHPTGDWPGEASYFIENITLEDAKNIGTLFQQNAIIWCNDDAIPCLILLR